MSSRKKEFLDGILEYLVEHGVANVSLRPMASQLGTSARILLFHFKSKEALLQEAMRELNARLQASFLKETSEKSGHRVPPLKQVWQWAIQKKNFPYLKLMYEMHILAIQNPAEYGRYLKKTSLDWQDTALKLLSEPLRTKPMATLCIAVFDGLFLELMTTGNRTRLMAALDEFLSLGLDRQNRLKENAAR